MTNALQETQRLGQSIWYDNISRGLLASGELHRLIKLGVTGVTSNPTIFEKSITGSTDYDEALTALAGTGRGMSEMYEALVIEDIRAAADLLRPVYKRTNSADGYVSLEVNPALAHDTNGTIAEAKRLFDTVDRQNVMVKVPATPQGIPAVRKLIAEGINVNVTLIFSLDTYRQVVEAYVAGINELNSIGGDLSKVASVASFFVSRVDTMIDALLEKKILQGREDLKTLLGKAAVANAKLAYEVCKRTFEDDRFLVLQANGARMQRPLWASTSTKNPSYSDVLYVEPLIGPGTVNTMPSATLGALLEHGQVELTLEQGLPEAEHTMEALAEAGISIEQVTAKLLEDGVKAFADSYENLLANIAEKKAALTVREHTRPRASLGIMLQAVHATLDDLQHRDVVGRIWRKDYTVWKPDPAGITNRLGWLTVTDLMREQQPSLEAFAREVLEAGYHDVVLLGMGGSSLGPEVLGQILGNPSEFPNLTVLDSTVPAWVEAVTKKIDPARTLFLVSSKSGRTIETLSLYKYFRNLAHGERQSGENFVAITDEKTSLESLARGHGFRQVFLNPTDVGGRYSVLSYFGLIPAALSGVDIGTLLDRANRVRQECSPSVPAHDNAGAWLGAIIGTLALHGRDKLTLVTSPTITSFGGWIEQLIAESTGKEGKGIIPVTGEPLVEPSYYGGDRLFVYTRLENDNNQATDVAIDHIESAGHPVVRLNLTDRYDLGGEFFRWEFATSVAGAILGIHPFDQPNVQTAKEATDEVLLEYQSSARVAHKDTPDSLTSLLSEIGQGDYLAIMAYVLQTPEVDRALANLRQRVVDTRRIAATIGYGPRLLHSTGQLHKGGPNNGLFLQLVTDHSKDLPIPGEPYTFGKLADAQALGDLKALQSLGRRVARVHLPTDPAAAIMRLANGLE